MYWNFTSTIKQILLEKYLSTFIDNLLHFFITTTHIVDSWKKIKQIIALVHTAMTYKFVDLNIPYTIYLRVKIFMYLIVN